MTIDLTIMDAIPVFSQAKSLVQLICGQREQAKKTQVNFSQQCPVVSQGRSLVEWSVGKNSKAAIETQKECGRFVLSALNGIPGIGHVKGIVHYATGDHANGELAIKSATRSTSVVAGGVGGFFVCGPIGATAAAIAVGTAYDSTVTVVDSVRQDTFKPFGILEPFAEPKNAGLWCDAVGGMVMDGATGYAAGRVVQKVQLRRAKGIAGRQIITDVITTEDKFLMRPAKIFATTKSLIIKAHAGYLYLLKNGQMVKIQEVWNIIKKYRPFLKQAGMDNTNEITTIDSNNSDTISTDEIVLRPENGAMAVYLGSRKIMIIEDDRIYIINNDGSSYELIDNTAYVLNDDTDSIEKLTDTTENGYISSIIRQEEYEASTKNSIASDDTMSVYQDALEEIVDDEEVALDTEDEEHPGLTTSQSNRAVNRI